MSKSKVFKIGDTLEAYIRSSFRNRNEGMVVHRRIDISDRARTALAFAERWGMVAGKPGLEDSQGRATLDLMPPNEVIERACDTADGLYDEFERRGWIHAVPSVEELGLNEVED